MPTRYRPWLLPVADRNRLGRRVTSTLLLFDGQRPDDLVHQTALDRGISAASWEQVVRDLRACDVLVPNRGTHEPEGHTVIVGGDDELSLTLSGELRRHGLGTRMGGLTLDELATCEEPRRWPDLVILPMRSTALPNPEWPHEATITWWHRGVAVLPVLHDDAHTEIVRVGPVLSRPSGTPCLACLGRGPTAADESPAPRPHGERRGGGPPRRQATALGSAVAQLAAATAVLMCLDHLSPTPQLNRGVSIDVLGPTPRLEHRRWLVRPGCPHHTPAGGAAALVGITPASGDAGGLPSMCAVPSG